MPLTLTDADLMIIRDSLEETDLTESMKSFGATHYDVSRLMGRILAEIGRRERFEEAMKRIDIKASPDFENIEDIHYAKRR